MSTIFQLLLISAVGAIIFAENSKAEQIISDKQATINSIVQLKATITSITAIGNTILFPAEDGNLYLHDMPTKLIKVIANINVEQSSTVAVLNGKVYMGSKDGNLHEYNPADESFKVVLAINEKIRAVVGLNNKIYYGQTSLFEYNPETFENKVATTNLQNGEILGMAALNGNLYVGASSGVFEYNSSNGTVRLIKEVAGASGYDLPVVAGNNKLYFALNEPSPNNQLFEYAPETNQYKALCANTYAYALMIANNTVYYGGSSKQVYRYDSVTGECSTTGAITEATISALASLNNKIYVGTGTPSAQVYELNEV